MFEHLLPTPWPCSISTGFDWRTKNRTVFIQSIELFLFIFLHLRLSMLQTLTELPSHFIRTGLSGWLAAHDPCQRGQKAGRKAPTSCHEHLWSVCLSVCLSCFNKSMKDKQENDCFASCCSVFMVLAALGVVERLVTWSFFGTLITTCLAPAFAQESSPVIIRQQLFPMQNNTWSIIIMVCLSRGRHPLLGGLTVVYKDHNNKKRDTHNS